MKILLINNAGDGSASWMDVEGGTTIGKLFESQVDGDPDNYLIKVNQKETKMSYVLKEKDRVTFTPSNIEGA